MWHSDTARSMTLCTSFSGSTPSACTTRSQLNGAGSNLVDAAPPTDHSFSSCNVSRTKGGREADESFRVKQLVLF